jgi:cell shape-determining protein MreC
VAQDFRAAFELGPDDKHIATVDEGGVALAAIQGLNQKLEEERGELKQKETEITELKQRLEKLEELMGRRDDGAR